jgi:hypothetical protein
MILWTQVVILDRDTPLQGCLLTSVTVQWWFASLFTVNTHFIVTSKSSTDPGDSVSPGKASPGFLLQLKRRGITLSESLLNFEMALLLQQRGTAQASDRDGQRKLLYLKIILSGRALMSVMKSFHLVMTRGLFVMTRAVTVMSGVSLNDKACHDFCHVMTIVMTWIFFWFAMKRSISESKSSDLMTQWLTC